MKTWLRSISKRMFLPDYFIEYFYIPIHCIILLNSAFRIDFLTAYIAAYSALQIVISLFNLILPLCPSAFKSTIWADYSTEIIH